MGKLKLVRKSIAGGAVAKPKTGAEEALALIDAKLAEGKLEALSLVAVRAWRVQALKVVREERGKRRRRAAGKVARASRRRNRGAR